MKDAGMWFLIGVMINGLIIGTWILTTDVFTHSPGPQATFETHVQALVDKDWELAHDALAQNCGVSMDELAEIYAYGIDPGEWVVEQVFTSDDEVLLYFQNGTLQYMFLEEGGWKLSCEGLS